jgi:parallel beta-helix repeat protein
LRRITALPLVLLGLIGLLLAASARLGQAQYTEHITINADGTVDPADAPVQRVGDTYTLTSNIDTIAVRRNDITLDGDGHTLSGNSENALSVDLTNVRNVTVKSLIITGGYSVYLKSVRNVTVESLIITGGYFGIFLGDSENCTIANNTVRGTYMPVPELQATGGIYVWGGGSHTISGNHIADNIRGICLGDQTEHNVFLDNNITGNSISGMSIWTASNNTVYGNRFINNTRQIIIARGYQPEYGGAAVNFWDNGSVGNFWSDYNGTDADGDGLGDSPYVVDVNNMDRFPLMEPFIIPVETSEPTPSEPFPATLAVAASTVTVAAAAAGLLVYFKKRKG